MQFQYEPGRIYVEVQGELLAELTYVAIDADTIDIQHTFVSDTLRGQGIAACLMEEAIKLLQQEQKQCIASCSYAREWLRRHQEAQRYQK